MPQPVTIEEVQDLYDRVGDVLERLIDERDRLRVEIDSTVLLIHLPEIPDEPT